MVLVGVYHYMLYTLFTLILNSICWHIANSSNSRAKPILKASLNSYKSKSSLSQTYSQIYSHCSILWSLLGQDGDTTHSLGYHTILGRVWLDQLKHSWAVRPKHPLNLLTQALKLSPTPMLLSLLDQVGGGNSRSLSRHTRIGVGSPWSSSNSV